MKRHPQLQDLSREHYSALKLALDTRRAGASGDAAALAVAAAACRNACAGELEAHFQLEERVLLPLLRAAGEQALVLRTEADHAELRMLASQLAAPDGDLLMRFADALTAHVRFEEREMFVAVERLLAPAA